jgi:hypothetical protein
MVPAPSLQELIRLVETETADSSPLSRIHAASGLAEHLAGVGDAVVGNFVDRARDAGHSWSQIGDALGVSKQAAQQKHLVRQASGFDKPGFDLFTPRARNAVSDAELVAREWGHDYVGTEHLLLALYRDPNGFGAVVLLESGLREDQAVEAIGHHVGRGSGAREGKLPFTRKATAAIDAARSVAGSLGHGYVGTEHLLMGLDRVDGVAKEVLEDAGLTAVLVDQQVIATLALHEQRDVGSTARVSRAEEKGGG